MRVNLHSLLVSAILSGIAQSRADVSFQLAPSNLSGIGTNEVIFSGIVSNSSTSNCLFLNGLQIRIFNNATNFLGADTNEFFANVPGILLPGESYAGEIFGILLQPGTAPGDYFGNVQLLGGTNVFEELGFPGQTFRISWPDSIGDGIPDWWRAQYFGEDGATTNSQSCAICDADRTGQNNLFKYTAGLDPTNSDSVFKFGISLSAEPDFTFGPIAPGRNYTIQFDHELNDDSWFMLSDFAAESSAGQMIVADTNAPIDQRFYRVKINLP